MHSWFKICSSYDYEPVSVSSVQFSQLLFLCFLDCFPYPLELDTLTTLLVKHFSIAEWARSVSFRKYGCLALVLPYFCWQNSQEWTSFIPLVTVACHGSLKSHSLGYFCLCLSFCFTATLQILPLCVCVCMCVCVCVVCSFSTIRAERCV